MVDTKDFYSSGALHWLHVRVEIFIDEHCRSFIIHVWGDLGKDYTFWR